MHHRHRHALPSRPARPCRGQAITSALANILRALILTALLLTLAGCAGRQPETAHMTPHTAWTGARRVPPAHVVPGIEVLLDREWMTLATGQNGNQGMVSFFDLLIRNRTVGLLTNPTGVDTRLRSTIDLLHEHPEVRLGALFAPEHGIRGDIYAGDEVLDDVEPLTGVTVYSIYRRTPAAWMLEGLDAVLYDIQDVGSTAYTYIYAMADMMRACAEKGIPFIVLDRPNPVGADYVDGPVLDTSRLRSGIGQFDIAMLYGMTPGELAWLLNNEFLDTPCKLSIIPMANYRRTMRFEDTGLPWVPTSTHVPQAQTALHYALTGVIGEMRAGINIGVGYTLPFECVAADWMDREELVTAINAAAIPGLRARPISYQPGYGSKAGQTVHGAHLMITDARKLRPLSAQITIMTILQSLYPRRRLFDNPAIADSLFDKALGSDQIRGLLAAGADAEAIQRAIAPRQEKFQKLRQKYLLYGPMDTEGRDTEGRDTRSLAPGSLSDLAPAPSRPKSGPF
jgi:uncharacterized protein YbbC (DUF1343 family)